MSPQLTFTEDATEFILEGFGKTVDEEGFIIEQESGERVLTPAGEEIEADDLGGIANGSEIFVEDNFASVVDYVEKKES